MLTKTQINRFRVLVEKGVEKDALGRPRIDVGAIAAALRAAGVDLGPLIPAVKLEVELFEGPKHLAGRKKEAKTWEGADRIINGWRYDSPTSGYWKSGFTITFADDFRYCGRYDICQDERDTLEKHVLTGWRFYSGLYRPERYTETQYHAFLDSLGEKTRDKHKALLEKYLVGDFPDTTP